MLEKNDLKEIDKRIVHALGEFFEKVLAPYLDKKFDENGKEHEAIKEQLDAHENDLDTLLRKSDKNDDDHDKIFQKLDEIERNTNGHERRIKKVEKILATS